MEKGGDHSQGTTCYVLDTQPPLGKGGFTNFVLVGRSETMFH